MNKILRFGFVSIAITLTFVYIAKLYLLKEPSADQDTSPNVPAAVQPASLDQSNASSTDRPQGEAQTEQSLEQSEQGSSKPAKELAGTQAKRVEIAINVPAMDEDAAIPFPEIEEPIPDFAAIQDVKEKKRSFFEYLRPLIREQNRQILAERTLIEGMAEQVQQGKMLSEMQILLLNDLARKYQLNKSEVQAEVTPELFNNLLTRVDVLPEAMILIQAANETGWGTSRFATEGRNYFGQWCFVEGCGLVPLSRTSGMNHEVAKFENAEASVASYLRNLNTNNAYKLLREIRADHRVAGKDINAESLLPGLIHYSERKQAYIDELASMLRYNQAFLVPETTAL